MSWSSLATRMAKFAPFQPMLGSPLAPPSCAFRVAMAANNPVTCDSRFNRGRSFHPALLASTAVAIWSASAPLVARSGLLPPRGPGLIRHLLPGFRCTRRRCFSTPSQFAQPDPPATRAAALPARGKPRREPRASWLRIPGPCARRPAGSSPPHAAYPPSKHRRFQNLIERPEQHRLEVKVKEKQQANRGD